MSGAVTFDAAVGIVAEICRLHREKHGTMPRTIVALGGTAPAEWGVRSRSEDVDLYLDEIDDEILERVQSEGVARFGDRFKVDATPASSAWGRFDVRDIAASPVGRVVEVAGEDVSIRFLDLATLYCLKSAADRDKDRPDRRAIGAVVSFDEVASRARTMLGWVADRSHLPGIAKGLAEHLARDYGRDRAEIGERLGIGPALAARIEALDDMERRRASLLVRAFATRHPDAVIEEGGRRRLDASHPEMSEALRQLLVDRPDLTDDVPPPEGEHARRPG